MNKRQELEGKRKFSKSARFILPMVDINLNVLPKNFINAYVTYDYKVIAVFSKIEHFDKSFYDFIERTENNRCYTKAIEEEDEVCVFFDIPTRYIYDFDLFIEGKYSKFTDGYKEKICKFYGKKSIDDNSGVTEYNTIKPQDFKRKQIAEDLGVSVKYIDEVLSKPDMDKETFRTLEQLIQEKDKIEHDKLL